MLFHHALVRNRDGVWGSRGLHMVTKGPTTRATELSEPQRLRLALGERNVAILPMPVRDETTAKKIAERMRSDIAFANLGQKQWNQGALREASTNGYYDAVKGVRILRRRPDAN